VSADKQAHLVTLEVDMTEPALVPAAFDLLRILAKAHGMPDVGRIYIHMTAEFDGYCYEQQIDELRARLNQLWIGGIAKHVTTPDPEAKPE